MKHATRVKPPISNITNGGQSNEDSGDLSSGGSWVDVVKKKKFRKRVSHIPCEWGVHCAMGSKCKCKHTEDEIKVFNKWPKIKWKTELCGKLDKHTTEAEQKWCPYAHSDKEAWCLKCKMTGHFTEKCAV